MKKSQLKKHAESIDNIYDPGYHLDSNPPVTQKEIIDQMAIDLGVPVGKAEKLYFSMVDTIVRELNRDRKNKVYLHGFGQFKRQKDKRINKWPVKFMPGKKLACD